LTVTRNLPIRPTLRADEDCHLEDMGHIGGFAKEWVACRHIALAMGRHGPDRLKTNNPMEVLKHADPRLRRVTACHPNGMAPKRHGTQTDK
jgi:hypothetical protein